MTVNLDGTKQHGPYGPTAFNPLPGFVTNRDTAPAYWLWGVLWIILADVHQTGGSYSVIEQWMKAEIGPPLHVHSVDEWFFVFEGEMDMQLGDEKVLARPGDSIWVPRGTPHGFKATVETHVLNGYAPGGVEQIIAGLASPAERRELPPDDFDLPTTDTLSRMMNNYWGVMADSPYAATIPLR